MATVTNNPTTSNTTNEHLSDHDKLGDAYNAQQLWVPAQQMFLISGTPALTLIQTSVNGWALDAAAVEEIGFDVMFPDDWDTYDADLVFACASGSNPGIVFRLSLQPLTFPDNAQGSTIGSGSFSIITTGTASAVAANASTNFPLVSGSSITDDRVQVFKVGRVATDAADTFTADVYVLGVLFTKVS